jgi:hypothetical protein
VENATGAVYTSNSVAINATVSNDNDIFCDSGPLARTGGSIQTNMASANISGVLSASGLECHTGGSNNRGHAEATAGALRVTLGGNTITANLVRSMVGTRCPPNSPGPSSVGHSTVRGLVINGKSINVSSATNQRVSLRNGFVLINEQTWFVTRWHAGRTVIGLRIVINASGEQSGSSIVVARTQAHIDCP